MVGVAIGERERERERETGLKMGEANGSKSNESPPKKGSGNKKAKRRRPKRGSHHKSTVVALPSKGGKVGQSNWELLKAKVTAKANDTADGKNGKRKRRRQDRDGTGEASSSQMARGIFSGTKRKGNLSDKKSRIVAMDCEMVGVGASASRSALARVAIVDYHGNSLLETFCRPDEKVTDFRTRFSGVRASDLRNAPDFEYVQRQVAALIKDKVVVGHALRNDFAALKIKHPKVRDTATYLPLRKTSMSTTGGSGRTRAKSLRELAGEHLGFEIQQGEHSPLEDARAALYLYHKHRSEWEQSIATGTKSAKPAVAEGQAQEKRPSPHQPAEGSTIGSGADANCPPRSKPVGGAGYGLGLFVNE